MVRVLRTALIPIYSRGRCGPGWSSTWLRVTAPEAGPRTLFSSPQSSVYSFFFFNCETELQGGRSDAGSGESSEAIGASSPVATG